MESPLTAEQIQRCKRLLLKKGSEINEKLTALMAGQKPSMYDLIAAKPGESPIERLQRFMKLVDDNLKLIQRGEYGKCVTCGDHLAFAHLEQIPWVDTCQKCASAAPQ